MSFFKLFDISVRHDYYRDSLSRDFEFFPTGQTSRTINNHKLRFKSMPAGMMLVARESGPGIFVPALDPSLTFSFWIKLLRPEIFSYTALPGKGPYLFKPGLFSPSDTLLNMTFFTEPFTENFTIRDLQDKTIFHLSKKPVQGFDRHGFSLDGLGNRVVLSYDESLSAIEINTKDKLGVTFSVTYEVPVRVQPGIFGLVEMALARDDNNKVIPDVHYSINLTASSSVLKYYFVFPKLGDTVSYSVVDETPANGAGPIQFNSGINLSQQPDPQDLIATQLTSKYSGNDLYRFSSVEKIPFRQAGRKFLRLKRDNDILVEHLPVPSNSIQREEIISFV